MIAKMTSWLLVVIAVCLVVLVVLYLVLWFRHAHLTRLLARLESVEQELWPETDSDTRRSRDAASLIAQARFLASKLKKPDDKTIPEDLVRDFDESLALWRDGKDPFADKRGPILKAYISEIDGTLQTYSVNVPEGYLADRPIPLLVQLHGHGWFRPFQGHPAPEHTGAITLTPQGRGATDYLYIGELDVLRAMAEVQRDYLIDDTRIYLTGSSMGGTGCWTLAVHHPDLFAGVAPRAGNADYHAWEDRWKWNPSDERLHIRLRTYLRDLDNPLTYAANLADVPVYCLHAAGDDVVPVEHARAMVQAVRSAGGDCRYLEFLSGNHGAFDPSALDEQLAWLAANPRQPSQTIHFVTGRLRQAHVGWVQVDGFSEPLKLATVRAAIDRSSTLVLTCDNVSALTLTPPGALTSANVIINGSGPLRVSADPDGALRLHLRGTRWVPGSPDPGLLRKRPGLEGPVDEVFLTPFILVYGTQGDDPDLLQDLRDEAGRFASEWSRRFGAFPRLCADTDLTPEDAQRLNLVLFGRPDQNLVLQRYADRLPIRISKDVIDAFGTRCTGEDVGTIFCYPNPDLPDRMLVVYAPLGRPAAFQMHTRFGKWFNWGVFDFRKWFDYAVYDARTRDPETFLKVGFFDATWNYDPRFGFDGVPALRDQSPPQGAPKYDVPPPDEHTVYLSDLRPLTIDQMRGSLELDRSFFGESFILGGAYHRRGLGVRVPSTLTYDIGGSFRTFRATVGLATENALPQSPTRRKHEAVRFVVLGDRKTLWQSEPLDADHPTADLVISVRGVHTLELQVIPESKWLWLHGGAAWTDARLIRH